MRPLQYDDRNGESVTQRRLSAGLLKSSFVTRCEGVAHSARADRKVMLPL